MNSSRTEHLGGYVWDFWSLYVAEASNLLIYLHVWPALMCSLSLLSPHSDFILSDVQELFVSQSIIKQMVRPNTGQNLTNPFGAACARDVETFVTGLRSHLSTPTFSTPALSLQHRRQNMQNIQNIQNVQNW